MGITIQKVIIHELVKEQHKPFEKAVIKSNVLPADNAVVLQLLEGVTGLYGRRNNSAHYGTFLDGAKAGYFPPAFKSYFEQPKPSDESFITLSHTAMDELERAALGAPAASGGYILAADYESDQGRFFLIAMLKKKAGIKLSEQLVPETVQELDLNSLHQAARINFERFSQYVTAKQEEKSEINYLSFVSPSTNKSTAGYFIKALGCSKGTASAKATDLVITESSAFFKAKPELAKQRIKFKQDLTSYLAECAQTGQSATLSKVETLARKYFPEDDHQKADEWAEELYARLNGEKNAVPNEFPVSSTVLKKHTFIKYKADKWDINFEVNALGITPDAEIQYDKQGAKLTIRHLPAEMREKIEEALRDLKVES
ncbi:nucleoid-associated protein [Arsukibacterium indicum]|uniref:Nucleoid-associated protein n=1 Tax=Arsukibacterium indicum TaxID=2848612 RepID=A0ABS6MPA0_9GAMM|nr:nucleoid-associated protein [Arsukibacterium indicum]MBV2130634.1 nucleoid-associated protein [Arsukibacterium indicum]